MPIGQSDTDPRIACIQVKLLQQANPAARFARARSLSETTIALARRAIRRRHPELSERAIQLMFVEQAYGRDIATRLETFLEQTGR